MVFQKSKVTKRLAHLLPMIQLPLKLAQLEVLGLANDSRHVKLGYLFVAVQGVSTHGKQFIAQAMAQGAVAVLVDVKDDVDDSLVPIIPVENLTLYLSYIAGCFYNHPTHKVPVIGVTGTNGKTTCSQLLAQAFARLHRPCGVIGTLGYGLFQGDHFSCDQQSECLQSTGMTTPSAIDTQSICAGLLDNGARNIVMEVSSHGLAQYRVAAIDIRTAIFTNLSHDHLDYHGDMESYGAAKEKLFAMPSVSTAIINQDDPYAKKIIAGLDARIQVITYSLYDQTSIDDNCFAHFSLVNLQMSENSVHSQIVLLPSQQVIDIKTKLVGHFNLSNLLAVVAALYANRYELQKIAEVVPLLSPVPGRMELIPNELGFRVVVDFAHTPDALKNALETLMPYVNGRLWCVFGCGGDRDRQKRPQMSAVAECFADKIIITSDNPRKESPAQIFADIEGGFTSNNATQKYEVIADRTSAIEHVINQAATGDIVLIAGKGHEDYQLIGNERFPFSDQQQVRFNLRQREAEEK